MNGRPVACPDDVMALVRRGAGNAAEWNRYVAHLQGCDDCYAAWLAARSFDGAGDVRPGDELVVRRAAEGALAAMRARAPERRVRRPAPRPTLALAAAIVLVTAAAASAGIFVHQRREAQRRLEASTVAVAVARLRHGGHPARPVSSRPLPPVPDVATPPPIEPPPPSPPPAETPATIGSPAPTTPPAAAPARIAFASPRLRAPTHAPDEGAAPAPTAGDLFARATAARRRGRVADAIASFRRLQREFPDTTEATVSLVSLAQLLGDRGQPTEALALFNAYLTTAPGGPLTPESLAGRARMLDRLGRTEDASVARELLRRRFPASPYSPSP